MPIPYQLAHILPKTKTNPAAKQTNQTSGVRKAGVFVRHIDNNYWLLITDY